MDPELNIPQDDLDPELQEQLPEDGDGEQQKGAPETLATEMYKIMVDGQEEEVDLETLKKAYSHGKGADKRMGEAGRLKSDATRLLEMLRNDPIAVRKELDKDWDEKGFLAQRLSELMEEEMLTPEQRQQKQDLRELEEYRSSKKKQQEEIKEKELQEHMNVEIEKLDKEFADAFEQAGLPKTNEMRRRLATMMLEANENGQDISALDLAKMVKKETQQELVELLKAADDETYEAILGSDLLTRSQKIALKKVKHPGNRTTPAKRDAEPAEEKKDVKKLRQADDILSDLGFM